MQIGIWFLQYFLSRLLIAFDVRFIPKNFEICSKGLRCLVQKVENKTLESFSGHGCKQIFYVELIHSFLLFGHPNLSFVVGAHFMKINFLYMANLTFKNF